MDPDSSQHETPETPPIAIFELRLYVVGEARNSVAAMSNLREICRRYLPPGYQTTIIDVREDPLRALDDQVLVTPTLVKSSPLPAAYIVGDLSQTVRVLEALGLPRDDGDA
jgi:circadian clock protein KaiB